MWKEGMAKECETSLNNVAMMMFKNPLCSGGGGGGCGDVVRWEIPCWNKKYKKNVKAWSSLSLLVYNVMIEE